mmetsp:Transcript_101685/g.283080  ORF Transcript_101685/g.283080 Transcript_101685/m.283080 type:complete len:326 (-) Transcript_101685:123-1100(-)
MLTDFNIKDFGRSIAIGLLGELGDKAFFVTLILAAWCPWQGIREGQDAFGERCLVCVGASLGLVARLIAQYYLPDLTAAACWFDMAACVALGILGLRAVIERRMLPESLEMLPTPAKEDGATIEGSADTPWNKTAFSWLPSMPGLPRNPFAAEDASVPTETMWNKSAFPSFTARGAPPAAEAEDQQASSQPASYGTMVKPPWSANGLLSERMSDSLVSKILAVPVTFTLVFITQADGKGEETQFAFGKSGTHVILGSILGVVIAMMLAVLFGGFLEINLNRRQALVPVIFTLFSISLVGLSQALLHLPKLQPLAVAQRAQDQKQN